MATYKPFYGLKKIEIGNATTSSNTDPTPLTEIPFTKVQTAVYANEANTTTPIPIEEQADPLVILNTAVGAKTMRWTTYSNDYAVLAALEGGTFTAGSGGTGDTYSPPLTPVTVNKFVKFTNLQNGGTKFYNAQISVVRNGVFNKEGLPELEVTATAQSVDSTYSPVIEFKAPAV